MKGEFDGEIPDLVKGCLDLSGKGLDRLDFIGSTPKLRRLVVSDNNLESFETLPSQPNLTELVASRNPILSLTGLDQMPKLRSIWLEECPIEASGHFRPRTLATIGPQLMQIDGVELTDADQEYASIIKRKLQQKLYNETQQIEEEDQEEEDFLGKRWTAETIHQREHQQFLEYLQQQIDWLEEPEQIAIQEEAQRIRGEDLPQVPPDATVEDLIQAILEVRKRRKDLKEAIKKLKGESH